MPQPLRDRAFPLGASLLAFVLALVQRPGLESSDTKIDLLTDPAGFLADVAAVWSPTGDLGHVQGGQYAGYLLPMGPFFALGRVLGLEPWLVQRLWLGLLIAVAAWGTIRLLDELIGRPRGMPHAVAALLVILNPYVVVFSARTSITLLGYAALPWLLLCVHRGLRAPRSWWWPAAFALAVTLSGGGVNAAVVAWVLVGPLLLAAYEWWAGGIRWPALRAFAWRTGLVTVAACVWWIVPALVHAGQGVDFLRFTEQPGTIWSTTSLAEGLRLMGYWISYLGVGYGGRLEPYFADGGVMLFSRPVVLAGLLVPALALGGFVFTRRWRYGPFFLLLVLAGLALMTAGFPEGTPLRRSLHFTYNHVEALRFLRTGYKAGPLVALGLACLAGAAAGPAAAWLRGRARWAPFAAAAAGAGARGRRVLAARRWPRPGRPAALRPRAGRLVRGCRPRRRHGRRRRPRGGAPRPALRLLRLGRHDRRRAAGAGRRAGRRALRGPVRRPALGRPAVDARRAGAAAARAARSARAAARPRERRRRGGGRRRRPRAQRRGARRRRRADVLDQLGPPSETWGQARREPRAAGSLGGGRPLPRVRAWDRPSARPLVRVEPAGGATVVDGGAEGIAGLAALGALPTRGRLVYAGDLDAAGLREAAQGGEVVISDSNRRRVLAAARMAQNHGAALPADEAFSADAAVLDLFPARGSDGQTVAVVDGVASLRAPFSPAFPQFPERRPFAAFDGDLGTHWQADRILVPERRWLEVTFDRPRDVDFVELAPYSDRTGRVTEVEVAGRRFEVRPGWNRLRLGLRDVRSLRVRIARVVRPPEIKPNPRRPARAADPGRARDARRCARRCWPSVRSRATTSRGRR